MKFGVFIQNTLTQGCRHTLRFFEGLSQDKEAENRPRITARMHDHMFKLIIRRRASGQEVDGACGDFGVLVRFQPGMDKVHAAIVLLGKRVA